MTNQIYNYKDKSKRRFGEGAVLLGDVIGNFISERLTDRHESSLQLQQAWDELLEPQLAEHCSIDGFSGGVLRVKVSAPGYMYEMRLRKNHLRSEINKKINCGRVKEIKLFIG